jgi:hypothetical protein
LKKAYEEKYIREIKKGSRREETKSKERKKGIKKRKKYRNVTGNGSTRRVEKSASYDNNGIIRGDIGIDKTYKKRSQQASLHRYFPLVLTDELYEELGPDPEPFVRPAPLPPGLGFFV